MIKNKQVKDDEQAPAEVLEEVAGKELRQGGEHA